MTPVSSVIPCPVPKKAACGFAASYIPSKTDADDIRVELYSPARSIVVAVAEGEGIRRVDVDFIALNGRCVPAYLLGYGSIELDAGTSLRAAWQSLYIPALADGVSPESLTFGTFSVSAAE